MAAGYTMTRPDNDNNHLEKAKLLDDIVMTLGGRVAEELIIQDVSAGASNDISVVTDRARKMVTEWGMSEKIGPVNYGDNDQIFVGRDYQTRANYSESMAALIDSEIETIIKDAYKKATELLSANKSLLDVMARVLIENETIYQDEVDMIMAGKSAAEVGAYIEERQKHAATNPFARTSAKINAEEEAKANASATPVNPTSSPDATETKPETPAETPTDDKPE